MPIKQLIYLALTLSFLIPRKNIILSADLANQFQDENLKAEIARLVNLIRQTSGLGHTIDDTGINLFPCVVKLYQEQPGVIKELAFKTDDGVAHREIARGGIDVREVRISCWRTASANINMILKDLWRKSSMIERICY